MAGSASGRNGVVTAMAPIDVPVALDHHHCLAAHIALDHRVGNGSGSRDEHHPAHLDLVAVEGPHHADPGATGHQWPALCTRCRP